MYADDITQIISQPGNSRKILVKRIKREVKRINNFEMKWKIKTITSELTIVPIVIEKTSPVNIDNKVVEYSGRANVVGLYVKSQGYGTQMKEIKTSQCGFIDNQTFQTTKN